jgi:arylsulfatase A-like enzyme
VLPYDAAPEDREALAPWYAGDDSSWCTPEGLCASEMLLDLFERDQELEGERLEQLTDLYDAGIRSLDREIGRLLDGLERRGLMENTVVLLTADHGEELFDHGKPLHGRCFDECLAVPFLLYTPPGTGAGAGGGVCDVLASHVDILPTLLDFVGLEPLAPQQGLSLAPLTRGGVLGRDREAVVIEMLGGFRGLRTPRWSLVPLAGERHLFDHDSDPGQRRELPPEQHPEVWQQLHELLAEEDATAAALRARNAEEAAEVSLSEEQRALLRSLGYAGD